MANISHGFSLVFVISFVFVICLVTGEDAVTSTPTGVFEEELSTGVHRGWLPVDTKNVICLPS